MRSKYLVFLSILVSLHSFGQSNSDFSKEEVVEDLKYLYESLKEAHYNLFAYTSEEDVDSVYQMIKESVKKDSLNLLETTSTLQRLISVVNNGHTEIDFPSQSYREYAYNGGTIFPLEIAFEGNKGLIRKNFSGNGDIKIGSELISVNGESMATILSNIYPQISAERIYFKNAKIEMYSFPRLYWQVYGKPNDFNLEINQSGTIKKYSIKAVNLIEGYEKKRTEILNATMQLKLLESAAYLNPGNFSGDENKYRQFIDSVFVKINKHQTKNLIIDLRNNSGGNNSFSDYLVSYIAHKPFQWHSRFSLKSSKFLKEHTRKHNDTTDSYFNKILSHDNGEIYDYHYEDCQPKERNRRFNGEVYVLINRQSHSQSAVAAAQIQDYHFGTIVGEETGDYATLYASQFQYSLPNTRVIVKVSKGQIIRVNGSEKQQGVMPDIIIKDHLLDEEDEILNGLLNRLN